MIENGPDLEEKDDISKLIESLLETTTSIAEDVSEVKSKVQETTKAEELSTHYTINDFKKFRNNLSMLIPIGFTILHEDLISLKDSGISSESSSESSSMIDVLDNAINVAPWIVGIATLGPTLVEKLLDNNNLEKLSNFAEKALDLVPRLIESVPKLAGDLVSSLGGAAGDVLSGTIDKVVITAQNIKEISNSDSEAYRLNKKLFKYFVCGYYNELMEPFGWEITITPDGEPDLRSASAFSNSSIMSGVADLTETLAYGVSGLIRGFIDNASITIDDQMKTLVENDGDVKELVKLLTSKYLTAIYDNALYPLGYRINLTNYSLERITTAQAVASDIGQTINSFIRGFSDDNINLKDLFKIDSSIFNDSEILNLKKSLATSIVDTTFSSILEKIPDTVKVGSFNLTPSINNLIGSIVSSINNDNYSMSMGVAAVAVDEISLSGLDTLNSALSSIKDSLDSMKNTISELDLSVNVNVQDKQTGITPVSQAEV